MAAMDLIQQGVEMADEKERGEAFRYLWTKLTKEQKKEFILDEQHILGD